MRAILFLACLPGLAWADDVPLRADIGAVTVYASGAEVARDGEAQVPAGAHRLLIPLPGAREVPQVALSGARLRDVALLDEAGVDFEALDTVAQAEARAALEAAEEETRAARQAVEAASGAVEAAAIRLRWLQTLTGGGEGGLNAPRGEDVLAGLLGTLAAETAEATADRVAAEAEQAEAQRALEEAVEAEAERRADLARLVPLPEGTPILALSIDADAAGTVAVELDGFDPRASWSPRYDLRLDTEAGTLALDRIVDLRHDMGEVWTEIELTLSTEDPFRGTAPSGVFPDPARAEEAFVAQRSRSLEALEGAPAPAAVQAEADMAEEETMVVAEAAFEGLSVRYDYPRPVTLRPGAQAALALDSVEMGVETEVRAVPRRDATAFLVANVTNPTAEPVLPGRATLIRDRARLGEVILPPLAPGGETEVGFGPMDTIRLTWTQLERGEGDAGVFRRASTLREAVAFEVENTGSAARDVLALYALPFSEQEDVGVEVRTDPAPDLRDWEDRRGVAGWELSLAPGETARVEMTFEIDWPEGQQLFWQP